LKRAIGKLTGIDALKGGSDPAIQEEDRREAAAEMERAKNPEQFTDSKMTSHFNSKLLKILDKLNQVRGKIRTKSEKTKLAFPKLSELFDKFKAHLSLTIANRASEVAIKPIGKWVDENWLALLRHDDNVFLKTTHPLLLEMKAPTMWATFKPHERQNFWVMIAHPIKLATIHFELCGAGDGLEDIADIVNDLLAAGGMTVDRDHQISPKKLISKAIERGCTPLKLNKIQKLFGRMQHNPKLLERIARLMRKLVPSSQKEEEAREMARKQKAEQDALVLQMKQEMQVREQQLEKTFEKLL